MEAEDLTRGSASTATKLAALLPLLGVDRFDRRRLNRALAALDATGAMKITVQVVLHADDDTETVVREAFTVQRGALAPDTLGLPLEGERDKPWEVTRPGALDRLCG